MLKRLVILSLGGHLAVIAIIGERIPPTFSLPAPELQVTLEGMAQAPAAEVLPPDQASGPRKPRPPEKPHAAAAAGTRPKQTVSSTPVTRSIPAADRKKTGGPAPMPANHLLSLLREQLRQYFLYPPLARKHGWEGRVSIGVKLEPDGSVHPLRIVRSSGYSILDRHAFDTLRRIGSIPQARNWLNGRAYTFELPVRYRLLGG